MRVDMHTHILPCVDDGSSSLDQSMEMMKQAENSEVTHVWLTPHFSHKCKLTKEELLEEFNRFKELCKDKFPSITLHLGSEVLYTGSAVDQLVEGKALTMGGSRYVLVEYDFGANFSQIKKGVLDLISAGYIPILAHVERYQALLGNDEKIIDLIGMGAYIQVNGNSFNGGIFDKKAKWCMKIFDKGMVHFIGSDAHDDNHRPASLSRALDKLEKKYGVSQVRNRLMNNHNAVIEDRYI